MVGEKDPTFNGALLNTILLAGFRGVVRVVGRRVGVPDLDAREEFRGVYMGGG